MPTAQSLSHTLELIETTARQIADMAAQLKGPSFGEPQVALMKAEHVRLSEYLVYLRKIVAENNR